MEVKEAIRRRKSIRCYKTEPVPKGVLNDILTIATRSPSGSNVQSWEIAVISGEVLENINRGNVEMLDSGIEPNPDIPMNVPEGVYRERGRNVMTQLFKLMGIAREDKERRAERTRKGYRFYDAPAGIILYADRSLDECRTQFDLGLITQTICLAALEYGLGTCIELEPVMYPQVIRRYIHIPESKRITVAIAIGYPDWNAPENKLETVREPVESISTWFGFN